IGATQQPGLVGTKGSIVGRNRKIAMRGLTLAQAVQIADGALAKAREVKCQPMTVAIVDAGGCLLVLKREDGSGNLRPDIAFAKAWGAVGMGIGGRAMAKRAGENPQLLPPL